MLGGGAGGLMTANRLSRKLDHVDVTVVDRSEYHYYQPSYYLIPFGYKEPDQQRRPIRDLLREEITFRQATVEGVDPDDRIVQTDDGDVAYDYLVVALGNALRDDAVDGLVDAWEGTDSVFPFYHYEAALELGEALEEFDGGRFVVSVPETPIKCGGAPLKLTMLAEDYFRRQGMRDEVDLVMTKPIEVPFGTTPQKAPYNEKIEEIWADRDIEFVPEFTVAEVDGEAKEIHSTDGRTVEYDMYAPVTPQYGREALTERSPLTGDGEYVTIDEETLQHDAYDEVFALGDCSNLPTSRTASAARKQTHTLVDNLAALIEERSFTASYDGYTACPLLTEKGKAMIAEFDYEKPISAPINSKMNWIMDVNVIPSMYWSTWMRGYDPVP
ncbi:FAD-dependent pyridine nucleotide-disulfideoxidoreductase [Natrarchaeobaculum sulfurireducens]|uniref:FAD-dependent pyridine nucleotide-disulfideoxidoreductase n=1 Tax=Natrarchaeobaculum sulfurireducens TaxID=2044521 RepID=A0A346PT51_9EURY|nr:NAD(FAD)-dependent dehydrogenase [Natrarchaeobaculum sulfurireducens]AXR82696.1 FAD-dependent pyridine nucleotide-disulfideoxidoreductase [Natrarchaeobaculum sulfurireducens]